MSENKSPLYEAIQITTQTIQKQAARFRNFVILVVLLVLISISWAGIQRSWLPLAVNLLLVPSCGIFIFMETYLLNNWQKQIIKMWEKGSLDLESFSNTIATIRYLPSNTLQSMLSTLPICEKDIACASIAPVTRSALAFTLKTINQSQNSRIVIMTVSYTLALFFAAIAAILRTWLPLAGLFFVIPVVVMGKGLNFANARNWKQKINNIYRQQGLDIANFINLASKLNWGSIPEKKKQKMLDSF